MKIKVGLLNANNERIEFLLPSEFNNLKQEILKRENNFNLQEENLNTEEFGEIVYSVTDSDCEEIKIDEPTNIFYLNVFLQIIEKEEIELSRKTGTYNTGVLKELISDILEMEKSSISLESIYSSMNPVEVVKKPKKKPMFTIAGLRAEQKRIAEEYRRWKYGKKTEKISMRVTPEEKIVIEEKAKKKDMERLQHIC